MTETARKEIMLGLGFIALAILGFFFIIPLGIVMPSNLESRALAPNFWPLIVMGILGVSGVIIFFQGFAARHKIESSAPPSTENTEEQDRPKPQMVFRVGVVFVVLFAFYFAISLVGIVLASMVVLAFLTWFAEEKRWQIIGAITILLPTLLYYFFVYVANIPMPLGIFET